jgi:hypothetical protein
MLPVWKVLEAWRGVYAAVRNQVSRHVPFRRRYQPDRAAEALTPELRVLDVVERALVEALRALGHRVVPALVGAHHFLAQLLELDLGEVFVLVAGAVRGDVVLVQVLEVDRGLLAVPGFGADQRA